MDGLVRNLLCLGFCILGSQLFAVQNDGAPRQKVSDFDLVAKNGYYLAKYEFKPYDGFPGYRHHYLVAVPGDKQHIYVYSPYACVYWGRFVIGKEEAVTFEQLPNEHRHQRLSEIDEEHYAPIKGMPPVPEAVDRLSMLSPPIESLRKHIEL